LLLSTLGVALAEDARSRGVKVQNIEVANAIEALACWLAFNGNGWSRDASFAAWPWKYRHAPPVHFPSTAFACGPV
jgi:hypothetical protein